MSIGLDINDLVNELQMRELKVSECSEGGKEYKREYKNHAMSVAISVQHHIIIIIIDLIAFPISITTDSTNS